MPQLQIHRSLIADQRPPVRAFILPEFAGLISPASTKIRMSALDIGAHEILDQRLVEFIAALIVDI
jgi:hypothetical protein